MLALRHIKGRLTCIAQKRLFLSSLLILSYGEHCIADNDAFVSSVFLIEKDQFLNCYPATGSFSDNDDDDKENIDKVIV